MFEVRCVSPLDDKWEKRDQIIKLAAGRGSDHSGAHSESGKSSRREHVWIVPSFKEALGMQRTLNLISGVYATLRERVSNHAPA